MCRRFPSFVLGLLLLLPHASAAVDLDRTSALLKEGETLSASAAADLERKLSRKPDDLEIRLRLLSYYAGEPPSPNLESVRAARAQHILWLVQKEPRAVVFNIATRVYAIQPTGGPLADPAAFATVKQAWQAQLAKHPADNTIRRNAATFFDIHDPAWVETLLQATGDHRWLGQVYAKAILGITATGYRSSDPISTSEQQRHSAFAQHALAELEASTNAALLGGAGFALQSDGSLLHAQGKLDWDYTPLARQLLDRAARIDPTNPDAFSTIPELPKHGETPPATIRLGGAQLMQSLRHRVEPVRPPGVPSNGVSVLVHLLIGPDGKVRRTLAVGGPAPIREAAEAAVRQWLFAPITMNGKPVATLSSINFRF